MTIIIVKLPFKEKNLSKQNHVERHYKNEFDLKNV